MPKIENIFTFHPTSVVAHDVDLVGEVTIGPNCVIHPSCTIVALGPIVFGLGCIVEEQTVICNRRKTVMHIGDNNLFSVGCRVEATGIGSHNIFEAKCKVSPDVEIADYCIIGAGCTVVSEPSIRTFESLEEIYASTESAEAQLEAFKLSGLEIRKLTSYSVIFGSHSTQSTWSGDGIVQAKALHTKHIHYLMETLPKFQRTRNPPSSKLK